MQPLWLQRALRPSKVGGACEGQGKGAKGQTEAVLLG